jgi:hypothetical protein
MAEPIEDLYLNWLYAKVAYSDAPSSPSVSYNKLLLTLHSIEFVWVVAMDENRAQDGLELRNEFLKQAHILVPSSDAWYTMPCSVLEMLIAFSRRAAFETEYSAEEWFWMMLSNLGLDDQHDSSAGLVALVTEVVDTLIWRTYDPDGHGGLFPLDEPEQDQRGVEIWHQFCEYLVDKNLY